MSDDTTANMIQDDIGCLVLAGAWPATEGVQIAGVEIGFTEKS